ncbi:major facilitator superfamily domain-containing protein [Piptocephalis cylindrospora]|uniref:Major facilitator superfamily domain-containing protein n=1 Tax=Piptocephalis cylindrospora TaxID=1907219 RepID=A0A4P9XYE3_9FUNG|nr:major facilitator superfamily domain-containing protein [Piptocephalis cylindrospora]|eukprot:RKP11397.1 major facilitator superfamily domain-containing protein [Piptocephalis cylindrospora]
MSKIGFGSFQWRMLILCGLGWLVDSMWITGMALGLPRAREHFNVPDSSIGLLSSSFYTGMMLGSMGWGLVADRKGRKLAFNGTLSLTILGGIALALSPNFPLACVAGGLVGFGIGGSLPVDGAFLAEFIPDSSRGIVTFLGIFFSIGDVLSGLIALFILSPFTCPTPLPIESNNGPSPSIDLPGLGKVPEEGEPANDSLRGANVCDPTQMHGWRYFVGALTMVTALMLMGRVLLFRLRESPGFLLSRGHREAAIDVLYAMAHVNGVAGRVDKEIELLESPSHSLPPKAPAGASWAHRLRVAVFPARVCHGLFGRTRTALTVIIVWLMWFVGMYGTVTYASFLPTLLERRGFDGGVRPSKEETYKDVMIYAACGLPGSFLSYYLISLSRIGRRGTFTILAWGASAALLTFSMLRSHMGAIMCIGLTNLLATAIIATNGVYVTEVFGIDVRATAAGIASACGRIGGMIAPFISGLLLTHALAFPIWMASVAFLLVGIFALLLPIETCPTSPFYRSPSRR